MNTSEILSEAMTNHTDTAGVVDAKRRWIRGVPPIVLPLLVIALRARLVPWVFMWLLAVAIFASCKWLAWWQARIAGFAATNWKRSAAYLLLWPGMDAQEFFADAPEKGRRIPTGEWLAAISKTLTGTALIWIGAGDFSRPPDAAWLDRNGGSRPIPICAAARPSVL